MNIMMLFLIALVNAVVGGCIGICGIAGFLLPMFYTGALGWDVTEALALSFLAFLVSGCIGSYNYYKEGNLDMPMPWKLGIGSFIGAIAENVVFLFFLGIATGAICSLSGAGGPVLVMPLLVACGVSTRVAVGVALFDSVFIALPACAGYLSRIDWKSGLPVLLLAAAFHGIGVWIGSRMAGKVPVRALKIFVAVFSVGIAIYMLI